MCVIVYMNAPIKPLQYKGNTIYSQNANILHLQFHIPRFMALHNNVQSAKRSDICYVYAVNVPIVAMLRRAHKKFFTTAAQHHVLKVYLQLLYTINLANKVDQTKMAKQEQHYIQVKHTR